MVVAVRATHYAADDTPQLLSSYKPTHETRCHESHYADIDGWHME